MAFVAESRNVLHVSDTTGRHDEVVDAQPFSFADCVSLTSPAFSPDGSRVAHGYSHNTGYLYDVDEIRVVVPGRRPVAILRTPLGGRISQLAWSPNGAYIAFSLWTPNYPAAPATLGAVDVGQHNIFVVHADGTGLSPIATVGHLTSDTAPTWSPDSTRLAFASDRAGGGLFVVDVARPTSASRLTALGVGMNAPVWAPRGHDIAFVGQPAVDASGGMYGLLPQADLWVVRDDGSGLHRLAGPAMGRPEWAPDASHVVYTKAVESWDGGTWVVDVATHRERVIDWSDDSDPHWTDRGRSVVFLKANASTVGIWRSAVSGPAGEVYHGYAFDIATSRCAGH